MISNYIKILLPAFALMLAGCQDNDISVNTDTENDTRRVEIAGPAGDITYKISDFIGDFENENLFVAEDGLIYGSYSQEVDIAWESLVTLPDFQETWYFSPLEFMGAPGLKVAADVVFTKKIKLNNRDDVRYDSLAMDNGMLTALISLPDGSVGDITITIPEIVEENGNPLAFSFYAAESNHTFSINESLAGKDIVPSQAQDSSYVSVVTSLDLSEAVAEDVVIDFSIADMNSEMTFGYFGQQEASKLEQQLTFDVFDELDMVDEIEFFDFTIDIETTSGIGVPFDVRTQNIQFFREEDVSCGDLTVKGNDYVDLSLEAAAYSDPVETRTTSFRINRENSENIVSIGNCYPDRMVFDVTSFSNPDGEPDQQNFMGSDNILKGKLTVILPAWFRTSTDSTYSRTDTIDFDFNDILGDNDQDARELEEFKVYFDFYSKIPLDISASAWVIDEDGNKIDDLLDGSIKMIKPGQPDESDMVQEAEHSDFVVSISGDKINNFLNKNAMNIVIQTKMATYENDYIKLYDDMDFKAVVSFDGAGRIPSF